MELCQSTALTAWHASGTFHCPLYTARDFINNDSSFVRLFKSLFFLLLKFSLQTW